MLYILCLLFFTDGSVFGSRAQKVERGKALAGRIKKLGYARDFEGMLEALEEGPKNAIVCT